MTDSKANLRRHVLAVLARMPVARRATASRQACALLQEQVGWKKARCILFFAPMDGELDIWPLLEAALTADKLAALPRFDPVTRTYFPVRVCDPTSDVAPGQWKIREPRKHCHPIPLNQLDFVLVPGVAFDVHGCRLGRGKGFYDRLLSVVGGTKCGVAFDEQLVLEVPVEPHDVHLDCILTPSRWIEL